MTRPIALFIALVFATASAHGVVQQNGGNGDRKPIEAIAARWLEEWNRHDMKALAALVAADADFITVSGTWLKGRKAFEEHHARVHTMQFKDSIWMTKQIHVKFVRPDIAVAHVEWGLRGDKDPDGTPRQPRQGIFTWVLEKRKAGWTIIAAQNTNIREPTPR